MHLPDSDNCIVPNAKISDYLLNEQHPEGGPKAKFFKSFGFDVDDIGQLQTALLRHGREREIKTEIATKFGKKFILHCEIATPDTRNPCVVSVWFIKVQDTQPTFVTAYPAKKKRHCHLTHKDMQSKVGGDAL
jgi:hypothetical protein